MKGLGHDLTPCTHDPRGRKTSAWLIPSMAGHYIYQMFIIVYNNTIIERKRHIGLCVWTHSAHILERLDIDRRETTHTRETLDTHTRRVRPAAWETCTWGRCGRIHLFRVENLERCSAIFNSI